MSRPRLLIVWHSQGSKTARMAEAVCRGAAAEGEVEVRMLRAADAGADDLRWADGIVLGTPENFGYMSGALKDFFDRTFYEVEGTLRPLPYALFVGAGNDGTGAVTSVERIARGYRFRRVAEPLIVRGALGEDDLARCETLGRTIAAGLALGIW